MEKQKYQLFSLTMYKGQKLTVAHSPMATETSAGRLK
jgi:hypothetical protein